jgi:hypothetical protein
MNSVGVSAASSALEQRGDVVSRRHARKAARRGQRGIAVASGHVQHTLARAQVDFFTHKLADYLQSGPNDRKVTGRPRGLLPGLDGSRSRRCDR